jgi:CBS domain-containing protein
MIIDEMEREVPTCLLGDSLGEAKYRAKQLGFSLCPVVSDHGIVLGVVRENAWNGDLAAPVEQVMESGPATVRPSYSLDDAAEMFRKNNLHGILVTSSDGKLMGILRRQTGKQKRPLLASEMRV